MILFVALLSRAGGPKCVAGTSYFNSTTTGQPLVWPQGVITYYTDQGDLSPILPNATANTFVASAFSVWTSVPTAAISAGMVRRSISGMVESSQKRLHTISYFMCECQKRFG